MPEVVAVQTHLEPLGGRAEGQDVTQDVEAVARLVGEERRPAESAGGLTLLNHLIAA